MAALTRRLADTSAWHRARHPHLAAEWSEGLRRDEIATTDLVRFEVLYSARSASEYEELRVALHAVTQLPTDDEALRRAHHVQRSLAHRGGLHHRVSIPDLIIAAVAEIHGATVWHYDADYDRIAEVTGQPTEWIAPRGSL